MSLEVMSFILGGILVAAGVFGGGIEIKELRLPQIGTPARVAACIVGAAFVVLAVYLGSTKNPPPAASPGGVPPTQPASPPGTATPARQAQTFQSPMHGDLRLDACLTWAQNCGEPAATAWCKSRGFTRATAYPTENVGGAGIDTRLIGSNQVCKAQFCASFSHVTCE